MPKSKNITGNLLEGEELSIEFIERKKTRFEKSISKADPLPPHWFVINDKLKTRIRIGKEKKHHQKLKDTLWCLFFKLKFPYLSTNVLRVELKGAPSPNESFDIDVMAADEDIVFIVKCLTPSINKLAQRQAIKDFANRKSLIRSAIDPLVPETRIQYVFIVASEGLEWTEHHKQFCRDNHLLLWDEGDIIALEDLADLAGEGAKYQLYNRIFHGKKIRHFKVRIPALKSEMGGHTYYAFVMTPEHLLKIAYVHRRSAEKTFLELTDSYQRMLKKNRLDKIEEFIEDGGFFPGSIIINFNRPPLNIERIGTKNQRKEAWSEAEPVLLTLPPYYGSAWIIDGQHRLYGYADTQEKSIETVPVIAFVQEPPSFQAKIFVDINKNQKAIPADLLWDLYEDLYADSAIPYENYIYTISKVAKKLNTIPDSPFKSHIDIPKENIAPEIANITLNTFCGSILREKLIDPEEELLFRDDFSKTVPFAVDRIKTFFNAIREVLCDEWEAGKNHYVRTNAAIVVFMGIFRDIVEGPLTRKEIDNINKFKEMCERFLEPLLEHLLSADENALKRYRAPGGASGGSRQIRREFSKIMTEAQTGFRSPWLERYEKKLQSEEETKSGKRGIRFYLENEECDELDFKGSLTIDLDAIIKRGEKGTPTNKAITDKLLQCIVAFLNTRGGILIIGVLEDKFYNEVNVESKIDCIRIGKKIVIGLEIEYGKRGWEGFHSKLIRLIKKEISDNVMHANLIAIENIEYEGKQLCKVTVGQSKRKQYIGNSFIIREGPSSIELKGKKIDEYWHSRK